MKSQFLTHEHSKMLKELGFDKGCLCWYNETGRFYLINKTKGIYEGEGLRATDLHKNSVLAPLYQQVKQWLWEKHKIIICVFPTRQEEGYDKPFYFTIFGITVQNEDFDSPITAETEGIKKAVEHLHQQLKK